MTIKIGNIVVAYEVSQIMTDPRSGSDYFIAFDEFKTLAEAKTCAKQFTKGARYIIYEKTLKVLDIKQ